MTAADAGAPPEVVIRPVGRPGDLGWVVLAQGTVYAEEFGWDASFEGLVARIVADFAASHDPAREAAWVAEVDRLRMGTVFCMAKDDVTAQLRILLVHPSARGLGVGTMLVNRCVRFATDAGYERITLWTNDVLVAARRLYQAAGFELVRERRHHSFGHDLVGQDWTRELGTDQEA